MEISLFQAILLGLYYWFGWALVPAGANFFDPLPASFFVGLIVGDVPGAITVGAYIQMIYMGLLYAGGQASQDPLAATIVTVPMVLASGMDPEAAIAVAIPIGLIGAQTDNLRQIVAAWPIHMADKYAAEGNTKGVHFATMIMPHILRYIVRGIPITILVFLGSTFSANVASAIPEWLMNALSVVGGVMPAVGFSIVAFTIGRKELFPFLIAGFFLVQFTGISVIASTMIAAFLSFMYWFFVIQPKLADEDDEDDDEDEEAMPSVTGTLVSRGALNKSWFNWTMFALVSECYERKTAGGFCGSILPALEEIYKDDEDGLKDAMTRHLEFFNTESCWGACIPGMAIALEEQKKLGAPVTGSMITSVKVGLMGPFAGIGDAAWGIFEPLFLGLFLGGAMQGSAVSALMPLILFTALFTGVSYYSFMIGYRGGTNSAHSLLGSKGLGSFLPLFSILGMFMMGALAATYVHATTPLAIVTAEAGEFFIQDWFDMLAPGLLSFGILMLAYWFTKKFKNFLWTALFMLAFGLIMGALGILA